MSDFLTTREIAALLRVKERKVYDLVAKNEIPVRRVTGKLLFAKAEIEAWTAGRSAGAASMPVALPVATGRATAAPPAICVGGHDPLLEWALRESGSGIAAFLDGALDGLERAAREECIAAGLHIPEAGNTWNIATVRARFGQEAWVLIEWCKRRRGLVLRRGMGAAHGLRQVRNMRFQGRQGTAGSELVLDHLLAAEGLTRSDLNLVAGVERSETDLAMAIAGGRAEVGLGIEAAARQFGLDFVPLIEERFDLMVWRHAYFEPPMQRLLAFCRTATFSDRAAALGGYDISAHGTVHFNGA